MQPYELIGERLKQARERAGLTQDQVAKSLGVLREQVSYFENGRREIDLVTLFRLADLYGYSAAHFLLGQRARPGEDLSIAFRAGELGEEDLEVVAWVQRFARNLALLDELLQPVDGR